MPRIITLVTTSTDRKIKITACEFLHAMITFMIGRTATRTEKNIDFTSLYDHIFPAVFPIAADIEDVDTKIFNTLCL